MIKPFDLLEANVIAFVGPLPPPVHGFSTINSKMLSLLSDRSAVRVFDLQPRRLRSANRLFKLARFGKGLLLFARFVTMASSDRPTSLYIGLSGGWAQSIDALFVLYCRLRRIPTYIHHHSFAYLNKGEPGKFAPRTVMRIAAQSTHIVLCDLMAARLSEIYGIPSRAIVVVSNAAYMDPVPPKVSPTNEILTRPLNIGFLSNITAEKGIFDFFDLLDAARTFGVRINGMIAGPVAPSIAAEFGRRLLSTDATHVGFVAKESKEHFLSKIDVFCFPTRYANEAEPVSILEALRMSIPVIAIGRGCIPSILNPHSGIPGWSLEPDASFVVAALPILHELANNPNSRADARHAAAARYSEMNTDGASQLQALLAQITA